MHAKQIGDSLFILAFTIAFAGLFFSPFMISLGTIMLALSAFVGRDLQRFDRYCTVIYSLPLLFVLSDFLRSENNTVVLGKFLLMLGFAILGFAFYQQKDRMKTYGVVIMAIVLLLVVFVNIISVSAYFLRKEELDQLLLQSKSIPIFGGMHHIHFGIINAISMVLILCRLFYIGKNRIILLSALFIIAVSFHILSSRTGYVSFYAMLLFMVFFYAIRERKWKTGLIGLGLIILSNTLAFTLSSSFQSKLDNSKEDIESWGEGEEINYKSMGMRIEAFKTSMALIADHFLLGVGSSAANHRLQEYYELRETKLYPENRIGPHNQFIEFTVKYGIFGLLFMILFFLQWYGKAVIPVNYGLMAMVLIILISSMFESLLERQVGIFIITFCLPFAQVFHDD